MKEIYGSVSTWTPDILKDAKHILKGLKPKDLKDLPASVVANSLNSLKDVKFSKLQVRGFKWRYEPKLVDFVHYYILALLLTTILRSPVTISPRMLNIKVTNTEAFAIFLIIYYKKMSTCKYMFCCCCH